MKAFSPIRLLKQAAFVSLFAWTASLHAQAPVLDVLYSFSGNLPEGGSGALPGLVTTNPPYWPLVVTPGGDLYGANVYGGGVGVPTGTNARAGGTGQVFYRLRPGEGFEPLVRLEANADRNWIQWLQHLTAGSDGRIYASGRGMAGMSGLIRFEPGSGWVSVAPPEVAAPGQGWVEGPDGRFFAMDGAVTATSIVAIGKDGGGHATYPMETTVGSRPRVMLSDPGNGRLYGYYQTSSHRNSSNGLFSVKADGSDFQVMHRFGRNPAFSVASIVAMALGGDGKLYVLSRDGGINMTGQGLLMRIDPEARGGDSLGFEQLYQFQAATNAFADFYNTEGNSPRSLVAGADGHLYGVARNGGFDDNGVLFRWHLERGYQVMHAFGPYTGEGRNKGDAANSFNLGVNEGGTWPTFLARAGDRFVGLAERGGDIGWGTLFRFTAGEDVPDVNVPRVRLSIGRPLRVVQGYRTELGWNSQKARDCVAASTEPGSTWTGPRERTGREPLVFGELGTWTYTLTCRTTEGEAPTVAATARVEVLPVDMPVEQVGEGGGAWLALAPLLPFLRRRRPAAGRC